MKSDGRLMGMLIDDLLRDLFLSLSKNQQATDFAKRYGERIGANRFVAGETIESAIAKIRELNAQGFLATVDHLGEFVSDVAEARASRDYCLDTLDALYQSGANSHLSLKLTQLGLDIDPAICRGHLKKILERAKEYGIFVRVDMEDSSHLELTLELVLAMRKHFHNVGTVMQAYLYRAEADVRHFANQGIPLRIVKGAYKEPEETAFPEKADVDENYRRLVQISLDVGNFTAIATHDEKIIDWAKSYVREEGIERTRFEFQMLYGIRADLQAALVKEGYAVRVYVPFGVDWFGYFMRRLAERPANVAFVIKGILKG